MPEALFRPAKRGVAGGVIGAVLLGVAACAPTGTTGTGAEITPTEGIRYGIIVAMRPVMVPAQQAGVATTAARPAVAIGSDVEFIVRDGSSQIISVVQTNEENFHPGNRVVLTRGARTRIARVPPS
jgi:outer membrane lipoprotein SlyB